MTSPYRIAAELSSKDHAGAGDDGSRELVVLGALVWIASVVRGVGAIARGEVLGAEPSLALLAAIALPWSACAALAAAWRRRRARASALRGAAPATTRR